MTKELQRLLTHAFRMVDQKRSYEAKDIFESLLPYVDDQAQKALVLYQLGDLSWNALGDGLEARRLFQETRQACVADSGRMGRAREIRGDVSENLMLLSLSYEEYESWAAELRGIRLDEPILLDHYPKIEGFKDRGLPWSHVLAMIACSYYRRDPNQVDAGLYGRAASTYHVILANRRSLRIKREEWAQVIVEHTALCIRLGNDTLNFASSYYPLLNPRPYLAIGAAARAFVEEYLQSNPADNVIRKMHDHLCAWAQGIEDNATQLEAHEAPPTEPIICHCGRQMQIFRDSEGGILLATCRADGIVRQIPGLSYSDEAIRRAANRYLGFKSPDPT